MAIVGNKQATIVERVDVNLNILLSEYVAKVSLWNSFVGFGLGGGVIM